MIKCWLKGRSRRRSRDSKFEEELGTVEAINGPAVTVSTPTREIVKHKNQVERYSQSEDLSTPKETTLVSTPTVQRSCREVKAPIKWMEDYHIPYRV